ncbi:unnamed protein product [Phytomonas sp. EM1]|nr:unnamed protein product [Phytomonas sp. EM1]|eukprot:CCW64929.1 unnamed protein product [Phytomonas sp. isolate EM1]
MGPYQHPYLKAVGGVCLRGRAWRPVLLVSLGSIRDSTRGGALWLGARHQIAAPTGPHLRGSWESAHQHDRSPHRGQRDEGLRGRQSRDTARGGSPRDNSSQADHRGAFSSTHNGRRASSWRSPTDNESTSDADDYSSRDTLAEPRYTFWQSLRRYSRRKMPFNPLHQIHKWGDLTESGDPANRGTKRFLLAIEEMFGRSKKRSEKMTVHLSEDQRHEIVARYASTRWWGRLYYPFRNISDRQIKWSRRISRVLMMVILIFVSIIIFVLYFQEVRVVGLLSPEDRRDYIHIVNGMRLSEVYKLADEVLAKEDPLMALPAEERCHLFLEAAREKNWHLIDWEVEARSRYPRSALDDFDLVHLTYWLCMTVGSTLTGSSTYFTDSFGLAERTKRQEAELSSLEFDPKALPEKKKRGFWEL